MSKRSRARAARPHRTWPQRLLITFNCCAIVVALLGAGTLAYAKREVNKIDRVSIQGDSWAGSEGLASDEPRNFLVVGADDDDGLDAGDQASAGREAVGGIRSDTIMVVRLDPATEQAQVLSFPRDLWVEIPGQGNGRINASLEFGGQDLLIETLKTNFDIDINHYVQVNFAGFQDTVDLLDGVPVWFGTEVRDQGGLNVTSPGCNVLPGDAALAYVRARHLRFMTPDGDWESDPTSDIGRIKRQQDFIKRVMRRAIDQGARNPRKLADLIGVGVKNITLDEATTPGDLVALGGAFRSFDPETLKTYSLPVVRAFKGGADVLDLQTGPAEEILARFRGTGGASADGTVSPAAVSVQVLNGSGKQNQAAQTSDALAAAGFQTVSPNSAAGVAKTEVRFAPGREAEAELVARYLFADVQLIEDPGVDQVTVVTGPDFISVVPEPRPAGEVTVPSTTTTTAPEGEEASSTSEAPDDSVTTTTIDPNIYLPETPAGEDC